MSVDYDAKRILKNIDLVNEAALRGDVERARLIVLDMSLKEAQGLYEEDGMVAEGFALILREGEAVYPKLLPTMIEAYSLLARETEEGTAENKQAFAYLHRVAKNIMMPLETRLEAIDKALVALNEESPREEPYKKILCDIIYKEADVPVSMRVRALSHLLHSTYDEEDAVPHLKEAFSIGMDKALASETRSEALGTFLSHASFEKNEAEKKAANKELFSIARDEVLPEDIRQIALIRMKAMDEEDAEANMKLWKELRLSRNDLRQGDSAGPAAHL